MSSLPGSFATDTESSGESEEVDMQDLARVTAQTDSDSQESLSSEDLDYSPIQIEEDEEDSSTSGIERGELGLVEDEDEEDEEDREDAEQESGGTATGGLGGAGAGQLRIGYDR